MIITGLDICETYIDDGIYSEEWDQQLRQSETSLRD